MENKSLVAGTFAENSAVEGHSAPGKHQIFVTRVLQVAALATAFTLGALLVIRGMPVLLLAFFGVLIGAGLACLADLVAGWTKMRRGWALLVVLLIIVAGLSGLAFGLGKQLIKQADELATQLPQAGGRIKAELAKIRLVKRMMGGGPEAQQAVDRAAQHVEQQAKSESATAIKRAVMDTASTAGSAVLVVFLGIFFAATPALYRTGALHLIPKRARPRAREVLDAMEEALRRWWVGALFAMASAAVMTFLGLWLLKIPLALTLGVIAGFGEFIPNFGPITAAVPAVMLGFLQGGGKALAVVGAYVVIQIVQSYGVAPLVQQRAVNLPPALQIVWQVQMAALFGPLGLLLAIPLLAVVMVGVQMLYIEDALHDELKHPVVPQTE